MADGGGDDVASPGILDGHGHAADRGAFPLLTFPIGIFWPRASPKRKLNQAIPCLESMNPVLKVGLALSWVSMQANCPAGFEFSACHYWKNFRMGSGW